MAVHYHENNSNQLELGNFPNFYLSSVAVVDMDRLDEKEIGLSVQHPVEHLLH